MARPSSIITVGANDDRPDYVFADGETLHVFEIQDGATLICRVPTFKGETAMTVEVTRWGKAVRIQTRGARRPHGRGRRGERGCARCAAGPDRWCKRDHGAAIVQAHLPGA